MQEVKLIEFLSYFYIFWLIKKNGKRESIECIVSNGS